MSNAVNQVPYLRVSREFPEDAKMLTQECSKSYLDIAGAVNERTIGIFPQNRPAIGGESWFFNGRGKQQNLRQVYTFTATGNIAHGINLAGISQISPKSYGSYTDGTNYYGVIYASSVAIAGQVSFYITPTNIVVQAGAGAPSITQGTIVLEWIANP
jgi:hypothetical protein